MRPVLFSSTSAAPCTVGAHPQFRPPADADDGSWSTACIVRFGGSLLVLNHADIDHIIEAEIVLDAPVRRVKRQHAAISDTDANIAVAALAAAFVENDRRFPMHVGKRQLHRLQSLLPRRQSARRRRLSTFGAELLDRVADIGLRPAKLDAAGVDLITCKSFLQRRLGHTLQGCVDGRVDGVRFRRQAQNAVGFRLAA